MKYQTKISTLWIVVMFNMLFADILTFMMPGFLAGLMTGNADDIKITQELLLVFALVLEIPIIMIYLSKVLKYKINRLLNIIAAVITILFVIAGGSLSYHYIFFATIEVASMSLILWYAWSWKDVANSNSV